MVEKNDEMATWMPMVCPVIRYVRTGSNSYFYHIAHKLSSSLRGMATARKISLPLNGLQDPVHKRARRIPTGRSTAWN